MRRSLRVEDESDRNRPRSAGGEEIEHDDDDEHDYGRKRGSFLIVLPMNTWRISLGVRRL